MIIACLAIGLLGALFLSAAALMSGFGILAAIGFYVLGGSVTTVAVACTCLWRRSGHKERTTEVLAAEA